MSEKVIGKDKFGFVSCLGPSPERPKGFTSFIYYFQVIISSAKMNKNHETIPVQNKNTNKPKEGKINRVSTNSG